MRRAGPSRALSGLVCCARQPGRGPPLARGPAPPKPALLGVWCARLCAPRGRPLEGARSLHTLRPLSRGRCVLSLGPSPGSLFSPPSPSALVPCRAPGAPARPRAPAALRRRAPPRLAPLSCPPQILPRHRLECRMAPQTIPLDPAQHPAPLSIGFAWSPSIGALAAATAGGRPPASLCTLLSARAAPATRGRAARARPRGPSRPAALVLLVLKQAQVGWLR